MAKSPILIRAGAIAGYTDLARTLQLDAQRLLRSVRLNGAKLSHPEALIPAVAVSELLERSAEQAGVEDFGLRLAARRALADLGPIGLLVREEPTVHHAIRAIERHLRLSSNTVAFHLEEQEDFATFRIELLYTSKAGLRQSRELAVGVVFRTIKALAGDSWSPEYVCFSHAAPAARSTHRGFFRTPVLFESAFDGFIIRKRELHARIPSADPMMARMIHQYLDRIVQQPAITIDATVRQLLFALLPSGRCTAASVARQIGIDRKTVHRRLASQDKTFSDVLNEVRRELAERHIRLERRSLTETAQLLGFSCLPNFSRWFRSQFGSSASAWRG